MSDSWGESRSRRWIWPLAYVMAVVLLIAGAGVYLHGRSQKHQAAKKPSVPPLAAQPFPVSMSLPPLRRVQVGQELPIQVQADSDATKVVSVQVWDGAQLVATAKPSSFSVATAHVLLPVLSPGAHVIVARVVDSKGRIAESAPINETVVNPAFGKAPTVTVAPRPQDTLQVLATRYRVPVSHVLVLTHKGAPIHITGPTTAIAPTDSIRLIPTTTYVKPALTDVSEAPSTYGITAAGVTETNIPHLDAQVSGCTVTLTPRLKTMDLQEGTAAYPGFMQKATGLQAGSPDQLTTLAPGVYVFEGSYPDPAGPLTVDHTPPVVVTVPGTCMSNVGWSGQAAIANGILFLPKPLTNFHLYVGVTGHPYSRIPADDSATLTSTGNELDISKMIPDISYPYAGRNKGDALNLQVWTGPNLIDDGAELEATGTLDLTQSNGSFDNVIGYPQEFHLYDAGTVANPQTNDLIFPTDDQPNESFTAKAEIPNFDHMVYQVTTFNMPQSDSDLLPEGILMIGRDIGATYQAFGIDFSKIPRTAEQVGKGQHNTVDEPNSLVALGRNPLPDGDASVPPTYAAPVTPPSGTAADVSDAAIDSTPPPDAGSVVFVRAIAMGKDLSGGEVDLGIVSNSIGVFLPDDERPPNKLTILGEKVGAATAANPDLAGCIRVTDAPWLDGKGAMGATADEVKFYDHKGTYCPSDYPPPPSNVCGTYDFECQAEQIFVGEGDLIVEGVTQLYGQIASTYNAVVDDVVDILAKFNPVCFALTAASNSLGNECDKVGEIVARAVVDAVLSAVGLPAELPSVSELESIAEGDLTAAAVGFMQELGVPCDSLSSDGDGPDLSGAASLAGVPQADIDAAQDPCTALVGVLLDHVKAGITLQTDSQVASSTGFPDASAVPGFVMVSEPNSHIGPTTLTVEGQNENKTTMAGFTCRLGVGAGFANYGAGWSKSHLTLKEQGTTGFDVWKTPTIQLEPIINETTDAFLPGVDYGVNANNDACFDGGKNQGEVTVKLLPPLPRVKPY